MVKISTFFVGYFLGYRRGVAKILELKNDPGDFYRAPKFDFLKILKHFFFGNSFLK